MNIRPYLAVDRQRCLDILGQNAPEYFAPTDRDEFVSFLSDLPGPYFVVELQGLRVACGGWALDPGHVAVLTWGMVSRNHHGQGIGRDLLEFRLESLKTIPHVTTVRVRTTQRTHGFFMRSGFHVIEVRPNGFGAGLDCVTMSLVLNR